MKLVTTITIDLGDGDELHLNDGIADNEGFADNEN